MKYLLKITAWNRSDGQNPVDSVLLNVASFFHVWYPWGLRVLSSLRFNYNDTSNLITGQLSFKSVSMTISGAMYRFQSFTSIFERFLTNKLIFSYQNLPKLTEKGVLFWWWGLFCRLFSFSLLFLFLFLTKHSKNYFLQKIPSETVKINIFDRLAFVLFLLWSGKLLRFRLELKL